MLNTSLQECNLQIKPHLDLPCMSPNRLLNKHVVSCDEGQALGSFELVKEGCDGNKGRYAYKCVTIVDAGEAEVLFTSCEETKGREPAALSGDTTACCA